MKIRELLKTDRTLLSFEFFPPKNPESENVLDETVGILKRFNPDFVSVTYGAGGSTREKSLHWTLNIKEKYGLNVMMHLTCIASSKNDIQTITKSLKEENIQNILALRGDPPEDIPDYAIKTDFQYANQLVDFLQERNSFSIGVAGYPEGHVEAPSLEKDIEYLKRKVDAGADFVISQIFFDNNYFYDFMDRTERAGINIPIIPGIMPIVNIGQVQRFTQMCGATVPVNLVDRMQTMEPEDMINVGVEYAIEQCRELLDFGAAGLHFYTLNRNKATEMILSQIEGNIRS